MNDLWNYLEKTNKPIVLYGMGDGADKIMAVLSNRGIKISGVFASDSFVRPKMYAGFNVEHFSALQERFGDMIVLLCFGTHLVDVIEKIKSVAKKSELYAPDVPVCPDFIFDGEYFARNEAEFLKVEECLADELSRKTFRNTINFKLTGKIDYLFDCEADQQEPYDTFLKLGSNETFVDLGAYRGDTVEDFVKRVGGYSQIFAVEPDLKTFSKLLDATKGLERIDCINALVGERMGKALFFGGAGRGSKKGKEGIETDVVSVDSLLNGKAATFIKMDVEGAEYDAIEGAYNTILNHRPKMQISAYHKSGDLLEIPKRVLEIRPDYKVYMRHFRSLPAWDTNFYFV